MAFFDREIDITRNIKIIEWLKSELLTDIADLFKALVNGVREEVSGHVEDELWRFMAEQGEKRSSKVQ